MPLTAKPQTTLKFSDQGYKAELLTFQAGLPSIQGPYLPTLTVQKSGDV